MWLALGIIIGLIGFITAATFIGGLIGYIVVFVRTKKDYEDPVPDDPNKELFERQREEGIAYLKTIPHEAVELRSRDGLTLRGFYIPTEQPSNKMVLLAHGFVSNRYDFACAIKAYHEKMGFNILMLDHRCHGESDGRYIGFSALEWPDTLAWAEAFRGRLGDHPLVALHGASMGGNVVLNANASNPLTYIKCVVADCPFTCGYEMVKNVAKKELHLHYPPGIWAMAMWFRVFTGKSLMKDTDSLRLVGSMKAPTLYVHGEADPYVPAWMGRALYDATRAERDCLFIEGAGHGYSYAVGKEAYEAKLEAFYGKYMRETEEEIN